LDVGVLEEARDRVSARYCPYWPAAAAVTWPHRSSKNGLTLKNKTEDFYQCTNIFRSEGDISVVSEVDKEFLEGSTCGSSSFVVSMRTSLSCSRSIFPHRNEPGEPRAAAGGGVCDKAHPATLGALHSP
jgi:hypothetical protein